MTLKADRLAFDDYEAALETYWQRGWTDGMPIVPPTPDKVQRFLDYVGLKPNEVIGAVPTREVTVTAEHVAINAVMAGCKAEYMPVVVAAVRAHLDEKGNCHSTTGTLSGASHAVIVNGPIRKELDINSKAGCFGPGWRANATIGRALRLLIRNVCRGIPGFLDRATYSTPARYSFCFGENEEDSPWEPLHVERGFPRDSSAVTVASVMYMVPARDSSSRTCEAILDSIVRATRWIGVSSDRWLGAGTNVVYVMGMEHLRYFAEAGWPKKKIKDYLYPRLTAPVTKGEASVRLGSPDGILIVPAGGHGMGETWILAPHLAYAITKPIETPRR